jgi:hypothetical protein
MFGWRSNRTLRRMAQVIALPDDPDGFRRQGGLLIPWSRFIADFRPAWRKDQHLTVVGMNGSGKSWLERWLLEACRPDDRVLLIDLKASDPVLRVGFHTVNGPPSWWGKQVQRMRNGRKWTRVVPPASRGEARRVVNTYMQLAYRHGSTTVVLDELRGIAGRPPNLGLGEQSHVLWQRGRARHVSVMSGCQSPVYIPRAAIGEQSHLFVGRIADSRRLPLLRDVVGDRGDELIDLVRTIKPRSYVFAYVPDDGPIQMIKAPAGMPGAKVGTGDEWTKSPRYRALYG